MRRGACEHSNCWDSGVSRAVTAHVGSVWRARRAQTTGGERRRGRVTDTGTSDTGQFLRTLSSPFLSTLSSQARHAVKCRSQQLYVRTSSDVKENTAHTANVNMLSPYQIPRASGQSRAIPAQVSKGDTGLSNRKWSCRPKRTKQ